MNTVLLGLRLAVAGGRESLARLVLTAFGVGVGVTLLLLCLAGQSALQGRADRSVWRDTTPATPATAPDPMLWLAVSDHYAGEPLHRVHVAALGPRPPVPPGLGRLPAAGESAVSPALRRLIEAMPRDQLGDRFPGRITATIGPAALAYPDQLVAVVGHSPEQLRELTGAQEVRGIQTGEPGDYAYTVMARILLAMSTALLLVPVVVYIVVVTRIAAVLREQRFAVMRLSGATWAQTAAMAAIETGIGALAGTVLGFLGYTAARPLAAAHLTHGGALFYGSDLAVPPAYLALSLAGVPLLAVATAVSSLLGIRITPLGIGGRGARRRPPAAWRVLPLAIGVAGLAAAAAFPGALARAWGSEPELPYVAFLACTLVGAVVAGPWACLVTARALARFSRRTSTLMAARRVAADPRRAFRAVSGVVLAVFVATFVAGLLRTAGGPPGADFYGGLRPGVVEVFVGQQPIGRLAPLVTPGTVTIHVHGYGIGVVSCAELSRVVVASCPLPASVLVRGMGTNATIGVMSGEFTESVPGADRLMVRAIYIPTDGTVAAEERVRTRAALLLPRAILNTQRDTVLQESRLQAELSTYAGLATWFVVLVAGCSLTAGVVAGLIERRRPFALLRASGVRLGELRRVVLLESALPMLLSVLMGAVLGAGGSYVVTVVGGDVWAPPAPGFAAGLAAGVLVALAITMAALPLMNVSTRYDAVRFE
ncbi:ABC transporter permease [Nonomuraea zeae]|uniref:FtsX-like permease family protein n=1 Tax=Nonomuraea zeae TaxID=1642303 RepID=A0A5S4G1U6_9ACTN|nr:FtsX-like permease family protein [Nonomuraea zeae]TMR26929.1 FtsX-like permease family protein [Nonomuraea zeae]